MLDESLREKLKGKSWIELLEALDIAYYLINGRDEILRHIPECPYHGPLCLPHAIEWIEAHKEH